MNSRPLVAVYALLVCLALTSTPGVLGVEVTVGADGSIDAFRAASGEPDTIDVTPDSSGDSEQPAEPNDPNRFVDFGKEKNSEVAAPDQHPNQLTIPIPQGDSFWNVIPEHQNKASATFVGDEITGTVSAVFVNENNTVKELAHRGFVVTDLSSSRDSKAMVPVSSGDGQQVVMGEDTIGNECPMLDEKTYRAFCHLDTMANQEDKDKQLVTADLPSVLPKQIVYDMPTNDVAFFFSALQKAHDLGDVDLEVQDCHVHCSLSNPAYAKQVLTHFRPKQALPEPEEKAEGVLPE